MGTYRVGRRLRLELRGRGAHQRPSGEPLSHETPRLALDAASDLRVILRTNLAMTPETTTEFIRRGQFATGPRPRNRSVCDGPCLHEAGTCRGASTGEQLTGASSHVPSPHRTAKEALSAASLGSSSQPRTVRSISGQEQRKLRDRGSTPQRAAARDLRAVGTTRGDTVQPVGRFTDVAKPLRHRQIQNLSRLRQPDGPMTPREETSAHCCFEFA